MGYLCHGCASDHSVDDFLRVAFLASLYRITRKLTIAAIMGQMDTEGWLTMSQAGVDVVPHGYNHEDLSTLTYQQQAKIIARTAEKYQQYAGQQPVGYIAPYNRINEDTTKACSKAGLLWITTYHGMARIWLITGLFELGLGVGARLEAFLTQLQ